MFRTKPVVTAVIAVAALIAGDTYAGQVRFNPSIDIGVGATDNVLYETSNETSDTTVDVAVDLPVERSWNGGSLSFRYRPSYVAHADVESLDRDEHRLDLRTTTSLGRMTRLSAALGWYLRQEQGGTRFDEPDTFEERDPFLTERSDRESSWASVSLARDQSPRWRWAAGLGWAGTDHDAITELANDPFAAADPNRVENRDELGGSFEISRQVSRRTAVGLELDHREYDLERSGDEQSDLFGLTVDHQANRRLSFSVSIGAARQSFDDASRDDSNDVQGALSLSKTFRRVAFGARASHRPSSGGHLPGSSTNTRAALSLGNVGDRIWGWNASLRYDRREPTDAAADSRDAIALGAGTERSFGPTLGLTLGLEWVDQSSGSGSDRSVARASAGLRWYPRGRAVTARGDDS